MRGKSYIKNIIKTTVAVTPAVRGKFRRVYKVLQVLTITPALRGKYYLTQVVLHNTAIIPAMRGELTVQLGTDVIER